MDDDDIADSFPLQPLTASVPIAWDMKFHIVLARRPGGVEFNGVAGALISSGAACIEMSESSRSLVRARPVALPPGRAHLIERGAAPVLLQLIHHEAEEQEPGGDAGELERAG